MPTSAKAFTDSYFALQCMLAFAVAVTTFVLFTMITFNPLIATFTASLAFIFTIAMFSLISLDSRTSYPTTILPVVTTSPFYINRDFNLPHYHSHGHHTVYTPPHAHASTNFFGNQNQEAHYSHHHSGAETNNSHHHSSAETHTHHHGNS